MKETLDSSATGTKSSQVDTSHHGPRSILFASLLVLGASFVVLTILTFVIYAFTTDGRRSLLQFFTFLSTGENALQLLAHLSGMFATIALIGLFSVLAAFLRLGRSKGEEGLSDLNSEQHSHQHESSQLDDTLFKSNP